MRVPAAPDGAQPDAPISAPGYAIAPNAVLRDARLSIQARLLYVVLDGHAGVRGRVRVRDATIVAELGCCERSFYKWSAELVAAGHIERKGTGRSAITTVINRVRTPAAELHDDAAIGARAARERSAALHDDAALHRIRSGVVTNNSKRGTAPAPAHGSPAPTSPLDPAAGGYLETYLRAVIEGADGEDITLNRKVRGHLEAIAAQGIKPEQLRELVAGWPRISWSGEPIHRLAGFVVGVVLPGIAQGQSAPTAAPAQQTPIPPTYQELLEQPVCEHGAEQGRCALCRRMAHTAPQRQEMPV